MTRKRKAVDLGALRDGKPKRNRASPCGIVKLYDHLTEDQVAEVVKMQLDSMLDIKCPVLYNTLNHWFAGTYDKDTREFVIPGRGRIPLNAQTVFRSLGLPIGDDPVVYVYDAKLASEMGPILFGEEGITPTTARVLQILIDMTEPDEVFKQVFVMYIMSTVIRPTTSPKVSSRCYPVMANVKNVHNMNWCQFVADQLHGALSSGKWNKTCLFLMQLLYVDSVDVSGLELDIPDGRFAVNIWSKENIDAVLAADVQADGKSFGKLPLKPCFGLNFNLFGGVEGFNKWIDTCTDPSCPPEQKKQVANLMGSFASGMFGLMGTLVQGWTRLQPNAGAQMAQEFGGFAQGFAAAGPTSSRPVGRATRASVATSKAGVPAGSDGVHPTDDRDSSGDDEDGNDRDWSGANMDRVDTSSDGDSGDDQVLGDFLFAARKKIRQDHDAEANQPTGVSTGPSCIKSVHPDIPSTDHAKDRMEYFSVSLSPEGSPIPHASAHSDENRVDVDGNAGSENIISSPCGANDLGVDTSIGQASDSRDVGIPGMKKKRLVSLRERHSDIACIVAGELQINMRNVEKPKDVLVANKMTPKRSKIPVAMVQPSRKSPRFGANKACDGVATSAGTGVDYDPAPHVADVVNQANTSRGPAVASDVNTVTAQTDAAIYRRKKGQKLVVQASRASPRLKAKNKSAVAATTSVEEVHDISPDASPDTPQHVAKEVDEVEAVISEKDLNDDNEVIDAVASPHAKNVTETVVTISLASDHVAVPHLTVSKSSDANVPISMPVSDPVEASTVPISAVLEPAIPDPNVCAGLSVGQQIGVKSASSSLSAGVPTIPVPVQTDAIRTSVPNTVGSIYSDVHVPAAQATDTLKPSISQVAANNGGFFPARMLFDDFGAPEWNWGSPFDSPVQAVSQPQPDANVGFVDDTAPGQTETVSIAEGTGTVPPDAHDVDTQAKTAENVGSVDSTAPVHTEANQDKEASANMPPDAPSVYSQSLIRIVEPQYILPLSFAMPTSAQNESVARDKGKISTKGDTCVISLDDLLCEKLGAQRPSSTSNPGLKEKNIDSEDVQVLCTPAMAAPGCEIHVVRSTPRTRLRRERVVQPSMYLLPPYICIRSTKHQDALYQKVIIHTQDSKVSRLKDTRILHIGSMWVTAGELAGSVKPDGLLSNTVAEIGINVLREKCPENKVIFPWIVTSHLLDHNFNSNILKLHFRRDPLYKLSHKSLLSFAVIQKLGTHPKALSHWFVVSLNLDAKRFEILDSIRGEDDVQMIEYATRLVDAIKRMYLVNYKDSRKQIQDYELVYIPTAKQDNGVDCGFFMLKFLELWDGRVSPAITFEQIPELRKVLTSWWLEHKENKLTEWRYLLDKYQF